MLTDKEIERRAKRLLKIAQDKNCVRIEREGGAAIMYFQGGAIFKCSGPIVDMAPVIEKGRQGLLF